MIVASERGAEAINKINQESCARALRHVIDEALKLLGGKSCTADEMRDLLKYVDNIATDLIERRASTIPKKGGES